MAYRWQEACEEIDKAQRAVERAQDAYSKGGSLDALNAAYRRLADSHADYREVEDGRPHDPRGVR
jgi:hypothetical protein